MACSKLVTMAIYVVKQACGNDLMASVYTQYGPITNGSVKVRPDAAVRYRTIFLMVLTFT